MVTGLSTFAKAVPSITTRSTFDPALFLTSLGGISSSRHCSRSDVLVDLNWPLLDREWGKATGSFFVNLSYKSENLNKI